MRPARRIVFVGFERHARRDATVSDSRTSLRTLNMLSAFLYVCTGKVSEMLCVRAVGYVNDDADIPDDRDPRSSNRNEEHNSRAPTASDSPDSAKT